MGLAATLGIVRAHQGAIHTSSRVGAGTTFHVYLPVLKQSVPAKAAGASVRVPPKSITILVVDDERVVAQVASHSLERSGFKTLLAYSGIAALDIIRQSEREISGVLLDLTLPVMNGQQVLREIRRIRPGLAVLLSSGYTEEDARSQIGNEEVVGFLQKPYTPKQLIQKINECIRVYVSGS